MLIVNGDPISRDQIRIEVGRLRRALEESGHQVTPEEIIAIREEAEWNLIDRALLTQEVARLSLQATTEEIDSQLRDLRPAGVGVAGCRFGADSSDLREEMSRRIGIDKLFDRWSQQAAPPSQRQIRAVYEASRDKLWAPEAVFVRQIVRNVHHPDEREPAREVLQNVLESLSAGGNFGHLAQTFSDCPADGGALGYIVRGEMVPEFEDVVFALDLNRHSPIFETRFGFHIALVTAKRPAGRLPFADAAPAIDNNLRRAALEKEMGKRLDSLRSSASIGRSPS